MKYRINGTLELDVTVEIEADSEQEAVEQVESMDVCVGNDSDEVCTSCNVSRFIEDGYTENMTYNKWDKEMSKTERMAFLKDECECPDERAFELAALDACDLDEEYIEQLEVE